MKWILLLAALVSLGYCQDPDCPNPVQCPVNPCETEICPRYLNAMCVADNCTGECRAMFINPRNDRIIDSESCEVEECPSRGRKGPCSPRRVCKDEVFPPNCAENERNCRQFIRPVCELPHRPPPPSDCSVVLCGPGMVCDVIDTRRGPEAKCVPFRPTNCEELGPCDPGMECRIRPRDGKGPVVRCVPVRTTERRPSDCSELECQRGFRCELFFGRPGSRSRARCVRDRPRPPSQTCEELNCEEAGMICVERGGRNRCRAPENCEEVTCEGDSICSIINIEDIPRDFRCPFNEARCKFQILNKLSRSRILGCRDRGLSLQSCDDVECLDNEVCSSKLFPERRNTDLSTCIRKEQVGAAPAVASCESVPDDFCGANEACIDFEQDGYRAFAHCNQINCNVNPCVVPLESCVPLTSSIIGESGISHLCAREPERALFELEETCANRSSPCPSDNLSCKDTRMNNVFVGSFCSPTIMIPPRECDELSCEVGEECVQDNVAGQVVRATCLQSEFISRLLAAFSEVIN